MKIYFRKNLERRRSVGIDRGIGEIWMKKIGLAIILILIITNFLAAPTAFARRGQVTIRVTSSSGKGKTKKVVETRVVLKLEGVSIGEEYTYDKGKADFSGLEPNTEYTVEIVGSDGWVHKHKFTTNNHGGAPQQNVYIS